MEFVGNQTLASCLIINRRAIYAQYAPEKYDRFLHGSFGRNRTQLKELEQGFCTKPHGSQKPFSQNWTEISIIGQQD
jgi:hypothetical protein